MHLDNLMPEAMDMPKGTKKDLQGLPLTSFRNRLYPNARCDKLWMQSCKLFGFRYGNCLEKRCNISPAGRAGKSVARPLVALQQVVSWYDNENSYTSQMVRTIKYFAEL